MEITACPICGSRNIGIGTLGDGIISGLSSWKEVCRDCGYQGSSLLFDSEIEYKKFVDMLLKAKKQPLSRKDKIKEENEFEDQIELKKKKNQKIEVLTEKAITPQFLKKKIYFFEFILAIVFSTLFFFVLFISSYISLDNGIFSGNDLLTMVLYLLGSFVGVLIFFFLIIIFIETIYRIIR
jgi:transcription elongation factor Elf1